MWFLKPQTSFDAEPQHRSSICLSYPLPLNYSQYLINAVPYVCTAECRCINSKVLVRSRRLIPIIPGVHTVQKSACCVLLEKLVVANLRSVDSHKWELCFRWQSSALFISLTFSLAEFLCFHFHAAALLRPLEGEVTQALLVIFAWPHTVHVAMKW